MSNLYAMTIALSKLLKLLECESHTIARGACAWSSGVAVCRCFSVGAYARQSVERLTASSHNFTGASTFSSSAHPEAGRGSRTRREASDTSRASSSAQTIAPPQHHSVRSNLFSPLPSGPFTWSARSPSAMRAPQAPCNAPQPHATSHASHATRHMASGRPSQAPEYTLRRYDLPSSTSPPSEQEARSLESAVRLIRL